MKMTNIAELKNRLSSLLAIVENGEEITICRRNVPIAIIAPIRGKANNRTVLGCGTGTAKFSDADLTEPLIPVSSWEMND